MKYLLDTNVLSALMKGDARAVQRLKTVKKGDVGIPQPALAELAYGISRLPRSKRKDTLRARLDLLCSELPRVDWSDRVSACFGEIKAALERRGQRIEDFDAAIAAHAMAQEAVLVTANLGHMTRVPDLVVEDWSA